MQKSPSFIIYMYPVQNIMSIPVKLLKVYEEYEEYSGIFDSCIGYPKLDQGVPHESVLGEFLFWMIMVDMLCINHSFESLK